MSTQEVVPEQPAARSGDSYPQQVPNSDASRAPQTVSGDGAAENADTPRDEKDDKDENLDDIFYSSSSDIDGDDFDIDGDNLTKAYNRQRQLHDAHDSHGGASSAATPAPRSNKQRPVANTSTSVDDQISALARHAAKIKLDSGGLGGGGGQRDNSNGKDKSDRATSEQVLDQRTRMILLQLINRGIVGMVEGAISTGKEANVYGAQLEDEQGHIVYRAIKVYKTAILVFKDRERYIAGEHRFRAGFDKGNNRKMVKLWAEKEYRNLRRIYAAGIPCPQPVCLKLHVMVMGFLGNKRGLAYPRLRDAALAGEDADQQWRDLYLQLIGIMRRLYQVCRLVHADLSEYNILYDSGRLYIIDVSQSVEPDHPRSLEFLRMDIKNVGDFFRRKQVDTLADRAVFNFVTAPEGTTELADMAAALERLYEARPAVDEAETAEAEAEREVDNEVFRNQYIPRTLEQVYDIEKDARKIDDGQGAQLVYKNLLADAVVNRAGKDGGGEKDKKADGDGADEADEEDEDDDEEEDGDGDDDNDDDDEENENDETDEFGVKRPRGHRFQPKDEKKAHKLAVKEAKREKRKEKMPKHVKKKLVAGSSSKKKH